VLIHPIAQVFLSPDVQMCNWMYPTWMCNALTVFS
jgi:hypothetical protein